MVTVKVTEWDCGPECPCSIIHLLVIELEETFQEKGQGSSLAQRVEKRVLL